MKTMLRSLFAISLVAGWLGPALASAQVCSPSTCPPPENVCKVNPICVCPMVIDPVCGIDGETYGNSCFARCECMPIAYKGECDDYCTKKCDGTKYEPVCGDDGQTYGNECYALCNDVVDYEDGACKPFAELS